MIRHLTLSLAALGLMIASADAAQIPAAPMKPGIAVEGSHLLTGRSGFHRHWHHHWHRHFHWHHHR